jgi:polyisoprenoid-binding protein YceI
MAELNGDFVVDPQRTRIGFVAAHRGGAKVRGHFKDFEGTAHLDANPFESTARLTVRTASIETGNHRRDAQLAKDFLGATTYPAMTFVTTKVIEVAEQRCDVTGDLTIRGTTCSLTVPFELAEAGDDLRLTASLTIDRHAWNANWNAFTTALVRADVQLDLDVLATRHR